MADVGKIERRGFVKLCASAVAAVGASPDLLAATGSGKVRRYARTALLDGDGAPLTAASLVAGTSYVFNYPYVTTPAFLVDLGKEAQPRGSLVTENGDAYEWQGGIGPRRSVVAFCAICTHKMTHPARTVSFINYRHEEVRFLDHDERSVRRGGVIYCCSEKSVYDPASGARVLGGPAPQPLTSILLEADTASGQLIAVGTCGGELYDQFFSRFTERLQLEYGITEVRGHSAGTATVVTIDEYSQTQITC